MLNDRLMISGCYDFTLRMQLDPADPQSHPASETEAGPSQTKKRRIEEKHSDSWVVYVQVSRILLNDYTFSEPKAGPKKRL